MTVYTRVIRFKYHWLFLQNIDESDEFNLLSGEDKKCFYFFSIHSYLKSDLTRSLSKDDL